MPQLHIRLQTSTKKERPNYLGASCHLGVLFQWWTSQKLKFGPNGEQRLLRVQNL